MNKKNIVAGTAGVAVIVAILVLPQLLAQPDPTSDTPTHEPPDVWETMVRKIAELRILAGEASVTEAGAPVLLVSQFTLHGRTAKGRRPSWSDAAPSDVAEPVIAKIAAGLRARGITVETGVFGAMMRVASVNEGPFTVLVEC